MQRLRHNKRPRGKPHRNRDVAAWRRGRARTGTGERGLSRDKLSRNLRPRAPAVTWRFPAGLAALIAECLHVLITLSAFCSLSETSLLLLLQCPTGPIMILCEVEKTLFIFWDANNKLNWDVRGQQKQLKTYFYNLYYYKPISNVNR